MNSNTNKLEVNFRKDLENISSERTNKPPETFVES
jgi:hypothetical protein